MARVTYDPGAKLKRWQRRLERPRDALKQIGALGVAESQAAFKRQGLGDKKWPARGAVNVFGIISDFAAGRRQPPKRRFQTRPALRDTGRLAGSFAFQVKGNVVEWGTNLDYAAKHHRGEETKSEKITDKVRRLLWKWLKKQGRELRRQLGWLLNPKFRNQRLTMDLPERPLVAITKQTIRDVQEAVGVRIFEVRSGGR